MKILVTGATGYIGKRLIPVLLEQGHELYCCVRDQARFIRPDAGPSLHTVEVDFLSENLPHNFPKEVDVAFYLIHSMNAVIGKFAQAEHRTAINFLRMIESTTCRHIIYLGGIANQKPLSPHLASRLAVEQTLRGGRIPVTALRAGIIVGSGGASFEIIRDLVEKLPLMIAPRWLKTKCQPIAIQNVMEFLVGIMLQESFFDQDFDIGGPEILTYEEMLSQYAEVRNLRRLILTVPVLTPRLSSYWLYLVTSTSYALAVNLVESMKVDIIARKNSLAEQLGISLFTYKEAVQIALEWVKHSDVFRARKDVGVSSDTSPARIHSGSLSQYGCLHHVCMRDVSGKIEMVWNRIWNIGGKTGWYYANFLWELRGLLDKLFGGRGLNRGRPEQGDLKPGDTLDFWRVCIADQKAKHLLLFAEMKLPGEAWLEFQIVRTEKGEQYIQRAVFCPRGLWGRWYWYLLLPVHYLVFRGMAHAITSSQRRHPSTLDGAGAHSHENQ